MRKLNIGNIVPTANIVPILAVKFFNTLARIVMTERSPPQAKGISPRASDVSFVILYVNERQVKCCSCLFFAMISVE